MNDHAVVPLTIETIDPYHEDARGLFAEAAVEARSLYDELFDRAAPSTVAHAPRSVDLLARLAGRPAGCAALRPVDGRAAEIERMYVVPGFRRRGIARTLLVCLERNALELGFSHVMLAAGHKQWAAMTLYEACGYHHILPFGRHVGDPTSVCFGKHIID